MPPLTTGTSLPWQAGVSGGVPNYTQGPSVLAYGAKADGVTDDYSAFANAIAACPNGSYVRVPAGHYRINSTIVIKYPQQIELRGDDTSTTIIDSYATNGAAAIDISSNGLGATYVSATSGYTRGSTSVVVSSASGFSVGKLAHVKQSFSASLAPGNVDSGYAVVNQVVRITGTAANTLQFDRPLYDTYSSGLSPVVGHWSSTTTLCGVRNLTVNVLAQPAGDGFGIRMFNFDSCWIINCVVTNAPHANIQLAYGRNAEVRDNFTNLHQTYDSNARYGIQLTWFACDCLIQNNICQANNLSIVLQNGSVGNVIAYNFTDMGFANSGQSMLYGPSCHGSLDSWNLIEGNVAPNIDSDGYWGTNQNNTYFRNWSTLKCYVDFARTTFATNNYAVNFEQYSYGHNLVGNVLSGFTDANGIMYNTGQNPTADSQVNATIFMHGNCSFGNSVTNSGTTQWANGVSQVLPASYYLASKPSWFSSLAWPPIGPDVMTSGTTITINPVIPAQARFMGVSY